MRVAKQGGDWRAGSRAGLEGACGETGGICAPGQGRDWKMCAAKQGGICTLGQGRDWKMCVTKQGGDSEVEFGLEGFDHAEERCVFFAEVAELIDEGDREEADDEEG